MEKQAVVFGDGTDADVVAFAEDELEAAVQVFHVRGGRVRGQRGWVVDRMLDDDAPASSSSSSSPSSTACSTDDGDDIPREVLVPELPDDAAVARGVAHRAARRAGAAPGAAAR